MDVVSLCNEALAEVPADAISTLEETSLEAEWCARLYAPTLQTLFERHDWKFPNQRLALAEIDNDRPVEWLHAYERPTNCWAELRVFPASEVTGEVSYFQGQQLSPTVAYYWPPQVLPYRYLISGNTIYTNVEDAILEFVGDASEGFFPALFRRAFVLELATRLVMPIKKDRQRQGDLYKAAANALDIAMADSINRDNSQSTYGDFVNESEIARGGGYWGNQGYWETR